MKNRDFEKLGVGLLPDLPGYTAKGFLVFHSPVDDFLRGICFQSSSYSKTGFDVQLFLQIMMVPRDDVVFSVGFRLLNREGLDFWESSDPDLAKKLSECVIRDGRPFLDSLTTPSDIIAALKKATVRENVNQAEQLAICLAREGRIDEAETHWSEICGRLNHGVAWQARIAERVQILRTAFNAGMEIGQLQLSKWSSQTRAALKLPS